MSNSQDYRMSMLMGNRPSPEMQIETLREEKAALVEALERTLSWMTSYPGDACMGEKGPYNQARAALKLAGVE